ncbi:MAG: exodeoxyribonuclease VII small subunit [Alphaproteobacteria bacterium]|nr:exodeoxyribonuclease VII small subunit [Alphaproteobacteria bacterium]
MKSNTKTVKKPMTNDDQQTKHGMGDGMGDGKGDGMGDGKGDNIIALSFEQAMAELEQLVATMERGDVPLQQAVNNYERGVALHRRCISELETARLKIEQLMVERTDSAVTIVGKKDFIVP